jgi:hypothetical protein
MLNSVKITKDGIDKMHDIGQILRKKLPSTTGY